MLTVSDVDSPQAQVYEILTGSEHLTASFTGRKLTVKAIDRWQRQTHLVVRAQDDAGLWSAPASVMIEVVESLNSQIGNGGARMVFKYGF
ncbi:hypothetical protein R5M92_04275 [Halomonas sp. Bachu 37]|uniref:hypothetical protein n=1 Tax=Halomonas kashgarensis TaxID=3084920 RepID=UPI00321749DC